VSSDATEVDESARRPAEQLDALVAPIALYPDDLLAQTLAASTYPLELIQLQQWLEKNKNLKDKALVDAVSKQPWDPSVQSMATFPEAVKRLANDIQWTTDLGNAFLVQQSDVMDAIQRMRKKAKDNGALTSSEQMKVETKVVEQKEVIVIYSSTPDVVYVPAYSPVVVYGPPVYPYPPIYYPPYPPGAAFFTFSVGVIVGSSWGHCGWGHNDVDIDINNNYNKINHYKKSGSQNPGGKWQHDVRHRGGTPYSDRATAKQYGGTARGDSTAARQSQARQTPPRTGSESGTRGSGGGSTERSGGDRIGNRQVESAAPRANASSKGGGLGGSDGSGGFSGSKARASSTRGASSTRPPRGGRRR
jgi:hypothetical protein